MNRRTILKAIAAVVSAPAGAMATTHEASSSQPLVAVDPPSPQVFGEALDEFGFEGPSEEWLAKNLNTIHEEVYALLLTNASSGKGARDSAPIKNPG
ncbi:MAG: hypothetical protein V3V08_05555 [Nannocystaceae bacterium]